MLGRVGVVHGGASRYLELCVKCSQARPMPRHDLYPTVMPEKSYQPDKWTARHRLICQLSTMYKNREIAQMLNVSEGHVSVVLSDPRAHVDVQAAVVSISGNIVDLHDRIKAHAVEALDDVVYTLRNSKDEKLRTKIGFGLLDRAGYTPVQKHMSVAPELPADMADRIEAVTSELDNTVVEAEYEYVHEDLELNPEEDVG
jgi:hypothetical protein